MKKIHILILILIGVLASNNISAQSINRHYVAKPEADGALYFLFPKELFKSKDNGGLTFDVTYKEKKSGLATINFTYKQLEMVGADSIVISYNDKVLISGGAEKIYIEYKKNNWIHRYSSKVDFKKLSDFYNPNITPKITLFKKKQAFAEYEAIEGKWSRYAPIGRRIVEVIKVNEEMNK